jgi:hypothetical protein
MLGDRPDLAGSNPGMLLKPEEPFLRLHSLRFGDNPNTDRPDWFRHTGGIGRADSVYLVNFDPIVCQEIDDITHPLNDGWYRSFFGNLGRIAFKGPGMPQDRSGAGKAESAVKILRAVPGAFQRPRAGR